MECGSLATRWRGRCCSERKLVHLRTAPPALSPLQDDDTVESTEWHQVNRRRDAAGRRGKVAVAHPPAPSQARLLAGQGLATSAASRGDRDQELGVRAAA